MTTLRVGIDLVDVARFEAALRRHPRLEARIFTTRERAAGAPPRGGERLAARFAAKEAAFKAFGRGWPAVPYHDVEVTTEPGGAPALVLHGKAAGLAGGRACAVSLSHASGLAVAEVILGV